jgi:hypothetical protein
MSIGEHVDRRNQMTFRLRTLNSALCAVALFGAFGSANAVDVVTGNVPQIDSNLVRNPCGLPDGTASGTTVQGCLNNNHAQLVDLTSSESLEIQGGQATLEATDGAFADLRISLVGADLGTLILNIDASEDGFVTFADGAGIDGTFALDATGENFFTATNISGGFLSFTTSLTSGGPAAQIVENVNQIRLGVVGAIPEPETYALLLAGLGMVGFVARRRKVVS